MRKESEKRLTKEGAVKLLDKTMMNNEYNKLKKIYQFVKGDWISQEDFCFILEEEFGVEI